MQPFKKNPKKQLEKFSTIFMQIGLVLVLFIVHVFIELETEQTSVGDQLDYDPTDTYLFSDAIMPVKKEKIIEKRETPKVEKKQQPKVLEKVIKGDNTVVETTLPSIDEEMNKVDTAINNYIPEEPTEPELENNVPFIALEEVPVFPGCKGDKAALRSCFNQKMQKHFRRKFDESLPNQLGLSSGKKNLAMLFVIDKEGNIVDLKVKAPHPKLEQEAVRIVNLLPKMIPGKQRGKPVRVTYALPVKVIVE
jgi:protein TonB